MASTIDSMGKPITQLFKNISINQGSSSAFYGNLTTEGLYNAVKKYKDQGRMIIIIYRNNTANRTAHMYAFDVEGFMDWFDQYGSSWSNYFQPSPNNNVSCLLYNTQQNTGHVIFGQTNGTVNVYLV